MRGIAKPVLPRPNPKRWHRHQAMSRVPKTDAGLLKRSIAIMLMQVEHATQVTFSSYVTTTMVPLAMPLLGLRSLEPWAKGATTG